MKSASAATYVSKKQMEAYSAKRQSRREKEAKKAAKKSANSEMIQPKADGAQLQAVQEDAQMENMASIVQKDRKRSSSSNSAGSGDDERYRSCEEVDSDELDGNLNLSDNEEEAAVFRARNKTSKAQARQRPARQYRQEIDTNVFQIEFSTLADKAELATGDVTLCKNCRAALNLYSKVEEVKGDGEEKQIWKCEFCLTENDVCLEEEEKPTSKAVNYILEAAAQVQDKMALGKKEISVVFCIDQSGSMCCSQPVQGKFKIKGDRTAEMKELMKFSDGSDQRLQAERNVTYVSRMQCLQAAIDQQIADMANGAADRKLGLVAFNNEVTVVGDGAQDPQIVTGDKLDNYDYLMQNGAEQGQSRMQHKIGDTAKQLTEKLMGLEETGPTALGPAVATAVAMAAEGASGSQVVICTDGLANVGLGAFDEATQPEQLAEVEAFYEKIGEFAKQKGLTVNIVSIIGDECNLDSLSKLAEMTGGNVERVDPASLTKNFANILSQPIIASNVVAEVKLHKGLQFRHENPEWLSEDKATLRRELGNVTLDTEITFEYTLKPISELAKMDDIDLTKIDRFPFQTQITYKALDGSKCIRVITSEQKVSNEREELEQRADFALLGQNAIAQGAKMARGGQHRFAQAYAKNWNRRIRKHGATNEEAYNVSSNYVDNFKQVYECMGAQDQMEQEEEAQEEVMNNASLPQRQFAEDAQEAPKKGGIFSALFGGFGSKAKTSQQAQQQPAKSLTQSSNTYVPQRKSKMSDNFASMCYKASNMSSKSATLSSAPVMPAKIQPPKPQPQQQVQSPQFGGMGQAQGIGAQQLQQQTGSFPNIAGMFGAASNQNQAQQNSAMASFASFGGSQQYQANNAIEEKDEEQESNEQVEQIQPKKQ